MDMAAKLARGLNLMVGSAIEAQKGDEFLPTVDPSLTWAMCGGFAKNRLNVLAGESGTGKTHIALRQLAMLMSQDPEAIVVIADTEYYFHNRPNRIKRLREFGIDTDRIVVFSTNKPSEVFGTLTKIEEYMKGGMRVCGCLVDSLGGVSTSSAEDLVKAGDAEKAGNKYGGNAKMIANIVRIIVRMAAEYNCTFFVIQHAMDSMDTYNPKPIIKGGQTLRLLSDTMTLFANKNAKGSKVDISGDAANTKTIAFTGKTIRCLVDKCRDGVEGRRCDITLDFESGKTVRMAENLCSIALALGVIYHPEGKNLMWAVDIDGETISMRGQDKFLAMLEEKDLVDKVLEQCLAAKSKIKHDGSDDVDVDFEYEED